MKLASTLIALASILASAFGAQAQVYPSRPVRMVIPISAGSGMDIIGRSVGQKLAAMWGQPVIADNRPGAGGLIGTAVVAKAPPDGYTLLVSGSPHAMNPAVYAALPYDSLRDFVEIAALARLDQALVVAPSTGIKSIAELIAAAKARPGQITYASPGIGTGVHFTGERFRAAAGIDVVHVPYKGGPEAMNDVMVGRVTYWIPSIGTALPFIKDGRLLALGVTSRQRSTVLPSVPTLSEAGITGFEDSIWFGLWAPARTPVPVVNRLAQDVGRALSAPDLRDRFKTLLAEPMTMPSAEFARFVRSETERAMIIARAAGIKPQ